MAEIQHAQVHFQGRVQGVGFRYAVMEVARGYDVAGYVQNLPDGRVVVEAEGDPAELERFIVGIEERMQGYIRKTERASRQRTAQFSGFTIR